MLCCAVVQRMEGEKRPAEVGEADQKLWHESWDLHAERGARLIAWRAQLTASRCYLVAAVLA